MSGPPHTGGLWVSNADSGDISLLRWTPPGELALASRLSIGGTLMPMAYAAAQRRLYVVRRSEPMAVITLAVGEGGALTPLGETPLPASMAYASLDARARFLLCASYQGHQLTVSPINERGVVGAVQQVVPTGPNAHAIVIAPDGQHVLATSLGGDVVMVFGFDADTGHLTPHPAPTWSAGRGAGPRHLRFHPTGPWVYLINELDASLDVLRFDAASGLTHVQTMDTLPPGFSGQPWAADLHLTPDGRFLYTSERNSSTLACFAVDAATGRVALQTHTPVEAQPRGFAIHPAGRDLFVVGQQSHHLTRFGLDPHSGALTPLQRLPVGRNPNWIEVFE